MDPRTLDLARVQFALTAATHFLFVALTLGLVTLVAIIQTKATRSESAVHWRMTRYWGQLYVINYAVGIVTGLVMEFQLGMNWGGLSHFAGNVFGSSLALETLTAFFIESTFLGLWIFGWGRLNKWVHLAVIWVVCLTAYASAYWILVSNGFLQHPAGARVEHGVLHLTGAWQVLSNASAVVALGHVVGGALVTAGFVMVGISAFHLYRDTGERDFFQRSLGIGLTTTCVGLGLALVFGGLHFGVLDSTQPMKLAVFDNDTMKIADLQAADVARYGPGNYVPSQGWSKASYVMFGSWLLILILSIIGSKALRTVRKKNLTEFPRRRMRLLAWAVPLPFLAMVAGWVFRETGRQPWTVYGLLKTQDAVSDISPDAMRISLAVFTALFAVLALVNYSLLAHFARRGPQAATLGRPSGEELAGSVPVPTY